MQTTPSGKTPLFQEVQRFQQIWIWALILFPIIFVLTALLAKGELFQLPPHILILVGITSIGVPLLFCVMKLVTEIRDDGIYVRFVPFHFGFRRFEFDQLKRMELRTYRPIREYGGWGLRWGFGGVGKAYNVSGNKGLQIETKAGEKLLIGTQKPEELERILNLIRSKKPKNGN